MREPQQCQVTYRGYLEPGSIDEILYEQAGIEVAISALQLRHKKLSHARNEILRLELAKKQEQAAQATASGPQVVPEAQ